MVIIIMIIIIIITIIIIIIIIIMTGETPFKISRFIVGFQPLMNISPTVSRWIHFCMQVYACELM